MPGEIFGRCSHEYSLARPSRMNFGPVERQLMKRLDYDLLFRWFVRLGIDDPVWDASTFSKNRDRLLEGDVAALFLSAILSLPRAERLLSSEHFSVDGP